MTRAVVFDCFGVLYPDTYWTLVRKYARDLPERRPLFHDLVKRADLGLIGSEEFWEEVAGLLGLERADIDHEVTGMGGVDEELLLYVGELKRRGYKTGVISNVGHGFIERVFGRYNWQDFFDHLTLSSEVGYIKPDPRIYRLAAEQLGVHTVECFFIDDSERNVDGARAVGMQAMQYTDFDEMRDALEKFLEPGLK